MAADNQTEELTKREMLIAKAAAKIAVQELSEEFYKQVGKTVVQKSLIWLGAAAVGIGTLKGWITINFPPFSK